MAAKNPWVNHWEVIGTSGKPYIVSKRASGDWGCSCPAWKFQKGGNRKDCSHILQKQMELMQEQLAAEQSKPKVMILPLKKPIPVTPPAAPEWTPAYPLPYGTLELYKMVVEILALGEVKNVLWLDVPLNSNTIPAIKRVREVTGWGLKESKDFVDAIRRKQITAQMYPAEPPKPKAPAVAERTGRKFRERV